MTMDNATSRTGADFLRDVGQAARDNPVPAALIGMGLVWLFSGVRPIAKAGELARRAGLDRLPQKAAESFEAGRSALRSGVDAAVEAASQTSSRVGETVQSLGGQIGETISAASENAMATGAAAVDGASQAAARLTGRPDGAPLFAGLGGDFFANARASVSDAFEKQPLLLGAVGIALGAGIAASIPPTTREAEWLGEASERVKESAQAFAREQTQRAQKVASDVADATADEARAQGLTKEDAKAAVDNLGAKLKNVAEAASNSARERLI
jgi:hypothetical protein